MQKKKKSNALTIILVSLASILTIGSISAIVSNANDDNKNKPSVNSSNILSDVPEVDENDVFANYYSEDRIGKVCWDEFDMLCLKDSDNLSCTTSIYLNEIETIEIIYPNTKEEIISAFGEQSQSYFMFHKDDWVIDSSPEYGDPYVEVNEFYYSNYSFDSFTSTITINVKDLFDNDNDYDYDSIDLYALHYLIINYITGYEPIIHITYNNEADQLSTMSLRNPNEVEEKSNELYFSETSPEEDLNNEVIWKDLQ